MAAAPPPTASNKLPRLVSLCGVCGAALPLLARLRNRPHCGRPACAHRIETTGTPERRTAAELSARSEVARRWPSAAAAEPVVTWLDPHAAPRLARTTSRDRDALKRHLLNCAAGGASSATAADPELAAPGPEPLTEGLQPRTPSAPQAAQLCARCGGRCCRIGLAAHAFFDDRLLDRWVEGHPGSGRAHAVQAYLNHVPDRHVQGSCLFHTAQGCALPRDERSAVCNRFACAGLQQVTAAVGEAPGRPVIALVGLNGRASRGVCIEADGRPHRLRDIG